MLSPLTIQIHSHAVLNRFVPERVFGFCLDGGTPDDTALAFSPVGLRTLRSLGLRPLAYRLRTELAIEAWHWNPEGRFSAGDRGYWTSSDGVGRPILASYGYRLPRRGDTFDQANDDGYSRLTDGDAATFWKSNPYLGDRPAWILVRLPKAQAVDALRVRWAAPYARRLRAEYWAGDDSNDVDGGQQGVWRTFPKGILRAHGGDETFPLGRVARIHWVRLWLSASSHTPQGRDPRDAAGFAVREIGVGTLAGGRFADALVHRPDRRQSATWVSSTDPWHRAVDRDPKLEQPGLDRVFRAGFSPVLMPAGVLYDTPENTAALARWLRRRRVSVRGFELGEEPDGQVCAPEDYAALYRRTAAALRAVDPGVRLGGPGFQTLESDYAGWALMSPSPSGSSWRGGWGERRKVSFPTPNPSPSPDESPWSLTPLPRGDEEGSRKSWTARFLAAVPRRELDFFTFEWYPFDDVAADPAGQLARAPRLLNAALDRQRLPSGLPIVVTEYGYSAFAAPAAVDLPGALLNLDLAGGLLARGVRAAYLYGAPPASLDHETGKGWGALATALPDGTRLPTYWAARMLTESWCSAKGTCAFLGTASPDPLLGAYTLRRPDGHTAVLLLNRDPRQPRTVRLDLDGRAVTGGNLTQYGPAQYAWRADGPHGHPSRSLPPARSRFAGTILLPPYSATVAAF